MRPGGRGSGAGGEGGTVGDAPVVWSGL
jgi:hypothetical protein